ncbi:MAG TPA: hypothetical protein VFN71_16350 [Methylomirabilota bacterium]|nr:hypothetical protein [Methylomirabilota bacterium]
MGLPRRTGRGEGLPRDLTETRALFGRDPGGEHERRGLGRSDPGRGEHGEPRGEETPAGQVATAWGTVMDALIGAGCGTATGNTQAGGPIGAGVGAAAGAVDDATHR